MKDGGAPMFKFKTTKTIQGVLIPFWWPGSGLVISSSWRDPRVTVESSWKRLLLFFLTRLTTPWSPRMRSVGRKNNKRASKALPKEDLLFPSIHHDLRWSCIPDPDQEYTKGNATKVKHPEFKHQWGKTWCQHYRSFHYRHIIIEVWGKLHL